MKECPGCLHCYEDTALHCTRDGQPLSPAQPWPLKIADKYRLDALIGRGGMSVVYRATQIELDRPVAIKILLPKLLSDSLAPERLRREALASARIEHPNVVTIYDYGTLPSGAGYLVMKLLRGYPLSKELRRKKEFSFEFIFNLMLQLCAAIEAAHRQGVIHCDLKPDNIFLEENESGLQVQVLDFGIAKLLQEASSPQKRLTLSGVVLGTPLYMSPEQCQSREVDFRADIYSLGVLLYELLTGQLPFRGDNLPELAQKHLNEKPLPPSQLRGGIPDSLEKAVLAALAKSPEQRPTSAAALGDELKLAALELVEAGDLDIGALPQLMRPRGSERLRTFQDLLPLEDDKLINLEQSTPGHITEVSQSLLTGEAAPMLTEQWSRANAETSEVKQLEDQCVLIVDDEPGILILLTEIAEQLGCYAMTAPDGKKALALIKEERPDLIISDVMMPEMDGYQLYAELQSDVELSKIPLIFLTARTQQQEKLQALASGVEDYWTKPFDIAEVSLRLRRILQRLQQMKKLAEKK